MLCELFQPRKSCSCQETFAVAEELGEFALEINHFQPRARSIEAHKYGGEKIRVAYVL